MASNDSINKGSEATTTAVFTFGRFQPPTIGHRVLISGVEERAKAEEGDGYIFVSSKQNDIAKYTKSKAYQKMMESGTFESTSQNENPLSVDTKVGFLKLQYAKSALRFINTTKCGCTTIFAIIDKLRSAGYTNIIMLVGSDRVESFDTILNPKKDAGGGAGGGMTPIKVEGYGEKRNMSVPAGGNARPLGVKIMKGTLMRMAAVSGNLDILSAGVKFGSVSDANVKELANQIRHGLGYPPLGEGGRRTKSRKTARRRSRRGTRKI